ncbi:hypothetical protein VN97_g11492 [Penicillium thymicola]|uniref:Uncharacterized protein n=1 Tax=Penicillium thymicola TaxID=293382 RepID=A0AAI9X362_PENTH|nr:hypothetical protein VN97_g11492 [Penicillium thymicola]
MFTRDPGRDRPELRLVTDDLGLGICSSGLGFWFGRVSSAESAPRFGHLAPTLSRGCEGEGFDLLSELCLPCPVALVSFFDCYFSVSVT